MIETGIVAAGVLAVVGLILYLLKEEVSALGASISAGIGAISGYMIDQIWSFASVIILALNGNLFAITFLVGAGFLILVCALNVIVYRKVVA